MATFSHESIFEAACRDGIIPGAVVVASDATGKFKYSKAFGKTAHGETLSTDSVMWIASSTKLMTSVAALQQVERGLIGLDDDTAKLLPEIAALQVLKEFDEEGKPVYEERKAPITLRRLLTHTTGLSAPMFSPKLQQLAQWQGPPSTPPKSMAEEFSDPLTFQPGSDWIYSTGYDWTGKLIERLSGLPLEDYMRANVWDPLNMWHMSYSPDSTPEMKRLRIGMSVKDESGKLLPLLQSLCANDGRVLGKELVDEMFRPQLAPEVKASMNHQLKTIDIARRVYGNSFDMDHQVVDQALGGEVGTRDEPGRRKAGTLTWGGLPNLIWWIDRATGLCGTLFTNVIPAGDVSVSRLEGLFEKAVYEQYEEFKKQA